MKTQNKKILTIIICLITLIWNTSPIFAQTLILEILGGGYELRGPSSTNFSTVAASKTDTLSSLKFADLGTTTPSEASNNFLEIIDLNGGNPFDVTASTSSFKLSEPLETTITTGSTTTTINVTSSAGFHVGDNFSIVGTFENNRSITSIPSSTSIVVSPALSTSPTPGQVFKRIVNCNWTPKKCILLENFSIANNDTVNTKTVIRGSGDDLQLNSQTDTPKRFGGRTSVIAGSTGSTLKVSDSSAFDPGEAITFGNPDSTTLEAIPSSNIISSIDDAQTITLAAPFTTEPAAGVVVSSTGSRNLTLANGTGAAPIDIKIHPQIDLSIPAGQKPGTYETTINFIII